MDWIKKCPRCGGKVVASTKAHYKSCAGCRRRYRQGLRAYLVRNAPNAVFLFTVFAGLVATGVLFWGLLSFTIITAHLYKH